jgi:hypothetical protein
MEDASGGSGFTVACKDQARGAWGAAASWPDKYSKWKKEPSVGDKAQRGCLGFLIFGVGYILLPLIVFLFAEIVIVAYALLVSLLWGIGTVVDSAAARRRRRTM